jgi:hypothetical protein
MIVGARTLLHLLEAFDYVVEEVSEVSEGQVHEVRAVAD